MHTCTYALLPWLSPPSALGLVRRSRGREIKSGAYIYAHAHANTPRPRAYLSGGCHWLEPSERVCVHTYTGTDTRLKSEPRRGECPAHTRLRTRLRATSSLPTEAPGLSASAAHSAPRPNTISRGEPIAAAFLARSSPSPRHCCDSLGVHVPAGRRSSNRVCHAC